MKKGSLISAPIITEPCELIPPPVIRATDIRPRTIVCLLKDIFQNAFGFAAIFVALWLGVDVGLIYHGGGFRKLLISGTASIAPGGKTSHVGNVEAQINRTLEVVEGILAARHMSLADTSRATAYFKSAKDVAVFSSWLKQRGVSHLPLV